MTRQEHDSFNALYQALRELVREHSAPLYGTLKERARLWDRAEEAIKKAQYLAIGKAE
jgi:hypothetical protein